MVADPSGSWEPSTAQQYIDQQIAQVNTNLTNEVIGRQTGDRNLQTNLTSEMNTRASQDANLNALINAGIREGGGVEFDIVPTQNSANGITSGGMYSTLTDPNVGFITDTADFEESLITSSGVYKKLSLKHEDWSEKSKYVKNDLSIGDKLQFIATTSTSSWNTFKIFLPKGLKLQMFYINTGVVAQYIYVTDLNYLVTEKIAKEEEGSNYYEYTAVQDCFVCTSSGDIRAMAVVDSFTQEIPEYFGSKYEIYTKDNSIPGYYFETTNLDINDPICFYTATEHLQYTYNIVKVSKDAKLKINVDFVNLPSCPFVILTDTDRKVTQKISSNGEYTVSSDGYIVFTLGNGSSKNNFVVIENNKNWEDTYKFKKVNLFDLQGNKYYSYYDFQIGYRADISSLNDITNQEEDPNIKCRPVCILLRKGESIRVLQKNNWHDVDNGKFFIVDANSFVCLYNIDFYKNSGSYSTNCNKYVEYTASQDVYVLTTLLPKWTSLEINGGELILDPKNYIRTEINQNLNLIESKYWMPGYVSAEGQYTYTSSGSYICTTYLKLEETEFLTLIGENKRANHTNILDISFYNDNLEFIDGEGRVDGDTTYYSKIGGNLDSIEIPSGSVYYRLSKRTENLKTPLIFAKFYNYNNYINPQLFSFSNYIDTSGNLQPATPSPTGWKVSEKISCEGCSKVFFNFVTNSNPNASLLAFYDSNDVPIRLINSTTGGSTVPDGSSYLRFCCSLNSLVVCSSPEIFMEESIGVYYKKSKTHIKNLLVLGDSYSQAPAQRWINQLMQIIPVDNLVNLSRGSATMKDVFTDRTQYPYTSRPQNGDNSSARRTSNLNTFGCQLALLDRLMEGTDLDSGETKIYETPDSYPNVILIEGGKNDAVENNVTLGSYANIIRDKVTAYGRRAGESDPYQTSVCLIKDVETVDRTTFIGSMYTLYKKLHDKFPNAIIIFINPSVLQYGNGDIIYDAMKSDAIDIASKILSVPVIDWNRQGRLSYVFNHVTQGSGTQADPYILSGSTDETLDFLHPNDKGSKYLAKVVAGFLEYYLN